MRSFLTASAFLSAALAFPFSETVVSRAEEPCAQVGSALKASGDGVVDAKLAIRCLKSVPVDTEGDASQLLGLSTFSNFQSTLAYLKNPPPGYLYPAVDIEGGLQKIGSKLKSGGYSNEFDIQNDISKLIISAYDGHFNYGPDITGIFGFIRNFTLISISKDGISVPAVYGSPDLAVLASLNTTAKYTPSPVIKINGEDVESFLNTIADTGANQDPDANYNSVFPIIPTQVNGLGGTPLLFSSIDYPGAETVFTFKNGTEKTVKTVAETAKDFTGVVDGRTFFNKFCKGALNPSSSSSAPAATSSVAMGRRAASASVAPSGSASAAPSGVPVQSSEVPFKAVPSQTAVPAPEFYPKPWVYAHDGTIACYYPSEQKDLAVISVPSFEPSVFAEFEDVTRECLATSKKLGKTKLMIDLRGNPGGQVPMAYDMFKQLFPSKQPWGTTNFHAWTLFNQMGQIITKFYDDTNPDNAGKKGFTDAFSSPFNANEELTSMDGDFLTWDDFYGPVHVHGDTFTNLVRYNLSDTYQLSGEPVSNEGELTGIDPKQTFDATDIVLLQDGQCGSTCAVFSEFMKTQGHVGQVVMGGRAQTGPMQGVGGVKGANVFAYDYLYGLTKETYSDATKEQQSSLAHQWGDAFEGVEQAITRSQFNSEEGSHFARVNIRNNIRRDDKTLTPLQFVYEAADCRLFYTAEQITNQALVWKAAYNSYWKGGACVQGSTNQVSSKPGVDYILYGPDGKPTTPSGEPTVTGAQATPTSNAGSSLAAGSLTALLSVIAVGAALF